VPEHPDIVPAQQALLLKEAYHETVRQLAQANRYDARFTTWMQQAEQTAAALQAALERSDGVAAAKHFTAAQSDCTRCHHAYRD
jgi:cytochrome c556